jgi:hypothetical protein
MKFFRLLFAVLFVLQATCLAELLHADGKAEPCAEACGTGEHHDEEGGESHGACHWHCATCTHPAAPIEAAKAPLAASASFAAAQFSHSFIPAAPAANIFHPPA